MEVPTALALALPPLGFFGALCVGKYIEDWAMKRKIKAETEANKKLREEIRYVVKPILDSIEADIRCVEVEYEELEGKVNCIEAACKSRMEAEHELMEARMDNLLDLTMRFRETSTKQRLQEDIAPPTTSNDNK